jgi:uncharacterized membrane protein YdjX (TVP38/TMEM64 family)
MSYKEIGGIVILTSFFILGVIVANRFADDIGSSLDFGLWGMGLYVLVNIVATVVAPISALPLIPLATVIWGPFLTAILSIVSWSIGSVIAFIIARRLGRPIVERFVDLNTISKYEKALGEKYLFWNVLFLRMLVPVDVLSYAIGIFTTMKFKPYAVATIIGITPFGFLLPFAVEASLSFQIFVLTLVLVALYIGYKKISSTKIQ